MSLRLTFAAALLAAATSVSMTVSALAQDARRGAALAEPCAQCHGANGRSQLPDIPSLAGQPADFITIQMILIREGLRQVPAMTPFAVGKSDQDIQDIAAYFATLPPGPPEDRRPLDRALFAAGQALSGPRHCATCHVSDYGGRAQIPRVAAQREDYLLHALTQYRDGLRAGPDTQMNGAVQGLSDADLIALAHYLSHRD